MFWTWVPLRAIPPPPTDPVPTLAPVARGDRIEKLKPRSNSGDGYGRVSKRYLIYPWRLRVCLNYVNLKHIRRDGTAVRVCAYSHEAWCEWLLYILTFIFFVFLFIMPLWQSQRKGLYRNIHKENNERGCKRHRTNKTNYQTSWTHRHSNA